MTGIGNSIKMERILDAPENTFIAKAEEMLNSDKMIVSLFRIGNITGHGKIFERWKHDTKCDDDSFKYMFTGKKLDDNEVFDLIYTDDVIEIPMRLISSQSRDKKTCRFMQSITEYFFDTNNTPDDLRLIFESDKLNTIKITTPQLHVSSIPINRNCRNNDDEKIKISVNMKHAIFNNDDDINHNTSSSLNDNDENNDDNMDDNKDDNKDDDDEDNDNDEVKDIDNDNDDDYDDNNDGDEDDDKDDDKDGDDKGGDDKDVEISTINNNLVDTTMDEIGTNNDVHDDNNVDVDVDDDDDDDDINLNSTGSIIRKSGRNRINNNHRMLDSIRIITDDDDGTSVKKRRRSSTIKDDTSRKCSKSSNHNSDSKSPFIVFLNATSNTYCYGKIYERGSEGNHLVRIYELKPHQTDVYHCFNIESSHDVVTELAVVPNDHFRYEKGLRAYKFENPPEKYINGDTSTKAVAKRSVAFDHNIKKRIVHDNNEKKVQNNTTSSNNTTNNNKRKLDPILIESSDYFGVVDEEISGIHKTWGAVIRGDDNNNIIWSRSKFNSPIEAAKAYDEYIRTNDLESKYELNFKAKAQSINIFNMKREKSIWFIDEKIKKLYDNHVKKRN